MHLATTTRWKLLCLALIGLLLLAACGEADPDVDDDTAAPDDDPDEVEDDDVDAEEREEVTLSFVTSFPRESVEHEGFWMWAEMLEEEAPWIELDYRGGPETIPQFQQGEAVRDGAVDMINTPEIFYVEQVPLMHAMKLTTLTPWEQREQGVAEIYEEHHRDNLNAHWLGHVMSNAPFKLFLNEEIDEPDLTGMDIRVSPIYVELVRGLGGNPVRMDSGDVFTALERGTVDGYGWTSIGLLVHGWQDVTEYEIADSFYETSLGVAINLDVWEGLEEETRQVITDTMLEAEREIFDYYGEAVEEETAERRDIGIELIEFSEEDSERFLEIAYERAWEEAIAEEPDAERLREIFGPGPRDWE